MSSAPPEQRFATFAGVSDRFPVTVEEAQRIAKAIGPVQQAAGAGSDLGGILTDAPGEGPQLVGTVLQNLSLHIDLATSSIEMITQAAEFYLATQTKTATEIFPPPQEAAAQVRQDFEPLRELIRNGPSPPSE